MSDYNKVLIRVTLPSGKKMPLNFIAPSYIKPDDKVVCNTSKGWIEGTVINIQKQRVEHHSFNKEVRIFNKNLLKTNNEEENKDMTNSIFNLVAVKNRSGYKTVCKSSYLPELGDTVAFQGNDGNLHVGEVVAVAQKGESFSVGGYQLGGFIAQHIELSNIKLEEEKEIEYKQTLSKLNAKKKQFEERALYEMLAKNDPEAQELLAHLDYLTK